MKNRLIVIFVFLIHFTGAICQPAIEWSKCFGGNDQQESYSLWQTFDGGYIVAGHSKGVSGDVTINLGGYDIWLVKSDSIGNIQWQKSYGGPFTDYASSVKQTLDGGYIITGSVEGNGPFVTNWHGGIDLWVLKLDTAGLFQWQTCLGGTSGERGNKIIESGDGGYIVAGSTSSDDGDVTGLIGGSDYWVVKLDSAGTKLWTRCYGGSKREIAYDIIPDGSGGFVLAGETQSNDGDVSGIHVGGIPNYPSRDFWIVNIDGTGNIIWQKCFGGTNEESAKSIYKTSDNGYIITGTTNSVDGDVTGYHTGNNYEDVWLIKIDSTGFLQWQHCYGGSKMDRGKSVIQSPDGGYLICGNTFSSDGDVDITLKRGMTDVWLIKTDSAGALLWQKCYGSSQTDFGEDLIQTYDGQYAFCGIVTYGDDDVTGYHPSSPGVSSQDYWMVKLSAISITTMLPATCTHCDGFATAVLSVGTAPFTYLWSNGQTTASADSLCAGTTTVTITDAAGTTYFGYFILPNDTVSVAMTQTSATCWNCPDGSATIIPQGGSGVYSYSWQGYPDTTPTLSGIPHDWYIGCVTDSTGCVVCDSIEVRSPVGLPDIKEDFVSLTPNPASENVVVNFSAGFNPNENYQLEIFTVQGKLIYSRKLFNQSTLVDLSTAADGLYFVKISTHGKSIVRKLVKNRM